MFDTSIYVENFRTGRFSQQILESAFVPRCSAVVLHELLRGARTLGELRLVRDLERQCRIITPTERHWIQAAGILKRIRERQHYDVAKIRELAFDVLIALSGRGIGATVITSNEADFRTISRYLSFRAEYW